MFWIFIHKMREIEMIKNIMLALSLMFNFWILYVDKISVKFKKNYDFMIKI